MNCLFGLIGPIMSCVAQACCWYSIFHWCGCIKSEKEVLQTEKPVVIHRPQPPIPVVVHRPQLSTNPFRNPSAPKDAHLQPAYGR